MPFDGVGAISGSAVVSGLGADRPALSAVDARGRDAIQRENIQRAVNVAAAILFGALGALAGVAVVIIMLVALVIPTTTTLAMAGVGAVVAFVAVWIWLKRRAAAAQADQSIAVAA